MLLLSWKTLFLHVPTYTVMITLFTALNALRASVKTEQHISVLIDIIANIFKYAAQCFF